MLLPQMELEEFLQIGLEVTKAPPSNPLIAFSVGAVLSVTVAGSLSVMEMPVRVESFTVMFWTLPVGLEAFWAVVPRLSIQACRVYVPGCTPRMVKVPPEARVAAEMAVPGTAWLQPMLLQLLVLCSER